ncbi:MAG: ribonuclease III [Clostridiales bacterium]|jgi:ribonuclease-3|nr:ribonuclease III [Clostridiales bacterium]HOA34192.1 ribonuclease III [Clostridiales bacterium]HOJ35159.1 ribonuclease III [Clostridiales bacterium]HOL79722.1 ribonuclease III [Clostridiales bacterium]HPP68498.1 ribonuclease III [Clostridiales bacterium]
MNDLIKKIGYEFKDESLLIRALTHSSYANESGGKNESNERLEFLGDSVLGFITAEFFFSREKDLPEGELTKLRAAAVCEKALSGFANKIGLGEYLLLGKGEINSNGKERPSILADAFEALIAAIYLDGGIENAKKFVTQFLEDFSAEYYVINDAKTILQEIVQKNPGELLEYVLVNESGPDHAKCFEVEVRLNANVIGRGKGRSKKQAEQLAAKEALSLMGL